LSFDTSSVEKNRVRVSWFKDSKKEVLNGNVSPGETVVIGKADPAARTPAGGFVSGGRFVVEDW
jgi:hypothetical protein